MHDSRSALPARSPIPFTQVLTQASWPASRSPSAPDTEFATAMPRSLWQCVSTGMPTAEASLANRSLIRPGESPPMVSQYRTRVAPRVPGRERELQQVPVVGPRPVLRVDPDRLAPPPARAAAHGRGHLPDDRGSRSSLPRNLCAIIWSEVEIDRL